MSEIDWYCEAHPWAAFGHEDCDGAGVLLSHVLAWAARVGHAVSAVIANAPESVEPSDDPSWCCGDDMGEAHSHGAYAEERAIATLLDNAYRGYARGYAEGRAEAAPAPEGREYRVVFTRSGREAEAPQRSLEHAEEALRFFFAEGARIEYRNISPWADLDRAGSPQGGQ